MDKRWYIISLVLCLFWVSDVSAVWSTDPAVNDAVVTAAGQQDSYQIIHDGNGGFFVVWEDRRDDGTTGRDIYAQYYDKLGDAQWGANGLAVSTAVDDQETPYVSLDKSGGIIIAWTDRRFDPNRYIYAQRLDALGAAQWDADGLLVLADPLGNVACSGLVSDNAGGAIILSDRGSLTRINGNGEHLWGDAANPVWFNIFGGSNDEMLIEDGSGGAYLVWIEDADVAVGRINSSGNLVWNDGYPVFLTYFDMAERPEIRKTSDGGLVIAWQEDDGVTFHLYAQKVSSSGEPQWDFGGVSLSTDIEDRSFGLAADKTGGAYVTWFDAGDGALYNQNLDNLGALLAADIQITPASEFNAVSNSPRKTIEDGSGGFITVWLNNVDEVRTQRLDSAGLEAWTTGGVVVCSDNATKDTPRVIGNNQGAALIIWEDERNIGVSDIDIYMQAIDKDGVPGEPGYIVPSSGGSSSSGGCNPGSNSGFAFVVLFGLLVIGLKKFNL